MKYGSGSLEIWRLFGVGLGFANTGHLMLACEYCGMQRTLEPGDRSAARTNLVELVQHIEQCAREPREAQVVGDGPAMVVVVSPGVYRPMMAPAGVFGEDDGA